MSLCLSMFFRFGLVSLRSGSMFGQAVCREMNQIIFAASDAFYVRLRLWEKRCLALTRLGRSQGRVACDVGVATSASLGHGLAPNFSGIGATEPCRVRSSTRSLFSAMHCQLIFWQVNAPTIIPRGSRVRPSTRMESRSDARTPASSQSHCGGRSSRIVCSWEHAPESIRRCHACTCGLGSHELNVASPCGGTEVRSDVSTVALLELPSMHDECARVSGVCLWAWHPLFDWRLNKEKGLYHEML